MPKLGEAVSTLLVSAVCVAIIFRVDMIRGLVTGIQAAKPGSSAPAAGATLYI